MALGAGRREGIQKSPEGSAVRKSGDWRLGGFRGPRGKPAESSEGWRKTMVGGFIGSGRTVVGV